MSTKRCSGFFLLCLDLELFAKIWKDLGSTDSQKPSVSITQDLKRNKKNPEHLFADMLTRKGVKNFRKTY